MHARMQWCNAADQLRPRGPELAGLMHGSRRCACLYGIPDGAPRQDPRHQSTGTAERRDQAAHRCARGFPNEAAIVRLLGAILLEQNDQAPCSAATRAWKRSAQSAILHTLSLPAVARSQRRSGASLLHHVMGHDLPRAYLVIRRAPENAGQPAEAEELMVIGRSIQRFWLTAKRLGLTMQPVLATLAFAHYGERQIQFSKEPGLTRRAESLARSFRATRGVSPEDVIFIARIGEPYPRLPTHRSGRRPLAELMS